MNFDADNKFVGYENLTSESKVIGLFKDGHLVDSASGDVIAIFDNTPFYAESGGQIGDQGSVILNNESFNVLNTIKLQCQFHEDDFYHINNSIIEKIIELRNLKMKQIINEAQNDFYTNKEDLMKNIVTFSPQQRERKLTIQYILNESERNKIKEWTNLSFDRVIFDTLYDDWSVHSSTLNEKINKK